MQNFKKMVDGNMVVGSCGVFLGKEVEGVEIGRGKRLDQKQATVWSLLSVAPGSPVF